MRPIHFFFSDNLCPSAPNPGSGTYGRRQTFFPENRALPDRWLKVSNTARKILFRGMRIALMASPALYGSMAAPGRRPCKISVKNCGRSKKKKTPDPAALKSASHPFFDQRWACGPDLTPPPPIAPWSIHDVDVVADWKRLRITSASKLCLAALRRFPTWGSTLSPLAYADDLHPGR